MKRGGKEECFIWLSECEKRGEERRKYDEEEECEEDSDDHED